MSRIYLATSDDRNREDIRKAVKKKYKNDLEIIDIQSTNELMSVLYQEYKVLFVDHTILKDISSIKKDKLKGQIFFMSPGVEEDTTSSQIKLFPNIITLIPWIRLNDFVNKDIEKNKINSNKDKKKKPEVNEESEEKKQTEDINQTKAVEESIPVERVEENDTTSDEKPEKETNPVVNYSDNPLLPKVDQDLSAKIKKECEALTNAENDFEDNMEVEDDDDEKDDLGRKTVANIKNDTQKTVALWSPLGQVGITQFIMNFPLYLAKFGIPVAVVEGITKSPKLKTWLNHYTEQPKDWISSLDYRTSKDIHKNMSTNFEWVYKGVKWYPLGEPNETTNNIDTDKYKKFLKMFIKTPYLTFISMENYGSMSKYNLETLKYVDELWLMVSGNYFDYLQYYEYTLDLMKDYPELKLRIIFNQYEHGISYVKQMEEKFNCKITCRIPYNRDLQRHRKSKPFIEHNEFYEFFKEPFDSAAVQLLGADYKSLYAIDRESKSIFKSLFARFS
ncbi:hypothetical protein [Ferdinandcohnia sp. SAFN-114]|uniref:hypothetical protein n=1 Tax=Ferdinandcohnia sp. SAFN-114 TaxID=3387275 RepID=UPI003F80063A